MREEQHFAVRSAKRHVQHFALVSSRLVLRAAGWYISFMTIETIRLLARYLDIMRGERPWPFRHPGARTQQDRILRCLADPAFGWYFVRAIHEIGIRMPDDIEAESVRHAYYWLHYGAEFEHIPQAHALSLPASARFAAILNALLLCRDTDVAAIGKLVNQPIEVIQAYGDLFFNVRDRLDDRPYIAGIVFPETRLADLREDAECELDFSNILLRAAYESGVDEVMYLAGLVANRSEVSDRRDSAVEFESGLLDRADLAVRYGRNEPATVIRQATSIAARRKQDQPQRPAEEVGLHSLGGAIMAELEKSAAVEDEHRLAVQRELGMRKHQKNITAPVVASTET